MSDCCQHTQHPKRFTCPANGKAYLEVSLATVLHHLKTPWIQTPKQQNYYFCDDPQCDVVYFGSDGSTYEKSQLRTKVGVKEISADSLICYCFGVTRSEAQSNELTKAFVVTQTKNANCSCTTSNPSGRCCLKDFPKSK